MIKRIILFIYNSFYLLFNHLIDLVYFFKDNIICFIHNPPIVLSSEETIHTIISQKASITRFGDGEFKLLYNIADLKFQKRSKLLSDRLQEILSSHENNLLIGIPKVFTKEDLAIRTELSRTFWKKHLSRYRQLWYKHLNKGQTYYNASFTRNYISIKNKNNSENYFNLVKKIWENREIIIVEGKYSRVGVGNDLFSSCISIQRILGPSEHAFEKYKELLEYISLQDKSKLIIIALGPTATVLAYDLYKIGFQVIDLGHLDIEYEWSLKKCEQKQPVKNKYVIEANSPIKDDSFTDETYLKEIINIID